MSRHSRPFKFKQFEVNHSRSSMKIGVDAVILGAWAAFEGSGVVLDVGCGCGVIALMAAQRNSSARVYAIDIDRVSVDEASGNFNSSPWSDRLYAESCDFNKFVGRCSENKKPLFDYIVSNPPYFDSGIDSPDSVRLKARHQGELSPSVILEKGRWILSDHGKVGIVVPFGQGYELKAFARAMQLYPRRSMILTGREGRDPKREFIEFGMCEKPEEVDMLTIERADGSFTSEYMSLCRDFYINF